LRKKETKYLINNNLRNVSTDLKNKIGYGATTGLITQFSDLNDAKAFGSYRSTLIAQILSITNRPEDITAGGHVRLDVMALSQGESYTLQVLYYTNINGDFRIYYRAYLTSWTNWYKVNLTKL